MNRENSGKAIVLIPARMASTRLPGKPLADICGLPMIVQVARRAAEADVGRVVVAVDDQRVFDVVRDAGFEAIMTRVDHQSGSDRIYEALSKADPDREAEFVINVQGDLPTIEPAPIRASLRPLVENASTDIATLTVAITDEDEKKSPNIVKIVGSPLSATRLRALYFTRATAPYGQGPLYHHIGLYAYRRQALEKFVALKPSTLEKRELLEQLRALEAGMRIDVEIVDTVPLGVDTPVELEKARRILSEKREKEDSVTTKTNRISFQGDYGANSDMACRDMFPSMEPLPCQTFEDAFVAVENGEADLAMIPIEKTIAGRVADIHHLLPELRLHIVGEYFMPIRFQLMVLPGVTRDEIRTVHSHIHALGQCRKIVRANGWKPVVAGDTAGAAKLVSEQGDRSMAALAPRLAADLYGLEIVAENVEDTESNVTRFVVLSREERQLPRSGDDELIITTFVFNVRNIPAALYKAMGGFATNGINMTKLESYQLGGKFVATQFYADIEGHPDDTSVRHAMEELRFFSEKVRILGTYKAHPMRGVL